MSNTKKYLNKTTKFTPAVVAFLIQDNKVLLGLRKEVSLGLGLNLISGIGGKVGDEPQYAEETEEDALQRELNEEIRVIPLEYRKSGRVRFIWTHHPQRTRMSQYI